MGNGQLYEAERRATGAGVVQALGRLTRHSDCLISVLNSPIRKFRRLFTRRVRDAVLLGRLTRRAVTVVAGRSSELLVDLSRNRTLSPSSTSGDDAQRPREICDAFASPRLDLCLKVTAWSGRKTAFAH